MRRSRIATRCSPKSIVRTSILGLKGLYYSHDFSRHGYDRNIDHASFAPFWDKVATFGLPVFMELSGTPHYDRASYIGNLIALRPALCSDIACYASCL